jgi:hypothetical protein
MTYTPDPDLEGWDSIRIEGTLWPRVPFGHERTWKTLAAPDVCNDCGATTNDYHEPHCDMEECPRCGGQLIGCPCPTGRGD